MEVMFHFLASLKKPFDTSISDSIQPLSSALVIICPVAIHDVTDKSHVKTGEGACARPTILAVLSKHSSPKHDKQLKVMYKGLSV